MNLFRYNDLAKCRLTYDLRKKTMGNKETEVQENGHLALVSGWVLSTEALPTPKLYENGFISNEDLVLIKWDTHDSYELAALKKVIGGLIWEIPDQGQAKMSEVSQWLHIPTCR